MAAYYNEIDPYAAQWLRNLIAAGHIAPGEVDERSIVDVRADDLRGFTQCHFFAGIGVWSHALGLAGWPDYREVWTGSCPCQPFSAAGKRGGVEDERHLWPEFFRLISIARPRVVFGEQVASKDGLAWLDIVSADMEGAGYAIGAIDTCAAGFGAPHIRQRLYFVADSDEGRSRRDAGAIPRAQEEAERSVRRIADGAESDRATRSLADDDSERLEGQQVRLQPGQSRQAGVEVSGSSGTGIRLEQPSGFGRQRWEAPAPGHDDDRQAPERQESEHGAGLAGSHRGATAGFWRDADWLPCIDGKARPVEPGTFPLDHGAPARVGRLRAYGNAICASQAQEFIHAYMTV